MWADQYLRLVHEVNLEAAMWHLQHIYCPREADENGKAGSPNQQAARHGISDAHAQQLRELFEQHGMEKGYLDTVFLHFGGKLPRETIAKQLRALGLKKGMLTNIQVLLPSL